MTTRQSLLLVDFENVHFLDFKSVPSDFNIVVFLGVNQVNLDLGIVQNTQGFGKRLSWVRCKVAAKDALDILIGAHIGKVRHSYDRCVIFSKDKGFDSLSDIYKTTRITTIKGIAA